MRSSRSDRVSVDERVRVWFLRLAWPAVFLGAHPYYRRLWTITAGFGALALAMRIAVVVSIADWRWFGPAEFVFLEGIAGIIAAPAVAYLIDRYSPRLILVAVETAVTIALLVFTVVGLTSIPTLLALVAVLAICTIAQQAARDSCLLDTLPRDLIARATGLDQAAGALALIAGPALGALLINRVSLSGIAGGFAAMHVGLLVVAWKLPRKRAGKPLLPSSLVEAIWPRSSLKSAGVLVIFIFAMGAAAGSLWLAVAPGMIQAQFHGALGWLGIQMTFAAVAAVVAGLLAPRLMERYGYLPVLGAAAVLEAAAFYVYALTALPVTSSIAITVIGFAAGILQAAFYGYLQHLSIPGERGRLFALVRQVDAMAVLLAGAIAVAWVAWRPGWEVLALVAVIYGAAAGLMLATSSACRPAKGAAADHAPDV